MNVRFAGLPNSNSNFPCRHLLSRSRSHTHTHTANNFHEQYVIVLDNSALYVHCFWVYRRRAYPCGGLVAMYFHQCFHKIMRSHTTTTSNNITTICHMVVCACLAPMWTTRSGIGISLSVSHGSTW